MQPYWLRHHRNGQPNWRGEVMMRRTHERVKQGMK
jgi:hypothetical protein